MGKNANNMLIENLKKMLIDNNLTDGKIRRKANVQVYNIFKNGDKDNLEDCKIYLFSIFKLCEISNTSLDKVFANI